MRATLTVNDSIILGATETAVSLRVRNGSKLTASGKTVATYASCSAPVTLKGYGDMAIQQAIEEMAVLPGKDGMVGSRLLNWSIPKLTDGEKWEVRISPRMSAARSAVFFVYRTDGRFTYPKSLSLDTINTHLTALGLDQLPVPEDKPIYNPENVPVEAIKDQMTPEPEPKTDPVPPVVPNIPKPGKGKKTTASVS